MGGYSFWGDLLDTYQSLPDWLKFMWLIVPPGFVLALVALLRHRPRPPDHFEPRGPDRSIGEAASPALAAPPHRTALPPAD